VDRKPEWSGLYQCLNCHCGKRKPLSNRLVQADETSAGSARVGSKNKPFCAVALSPVNLGNAPIARFWTIAVGLSVLLCITPSSTLIGPAYRPNSISIHPAVASTSYQIFGKGRPVTVMTVAKCFSGSEALRDLQPVLTHGFIRATCSNSINLISAYLVMVSVNRTVRSDMAARAYPVAHRGDAAVKPSFSLKNRFHQQGAQRDGTNERSSPYRS
jgi:hypothetical protein